MLKFEIDDLAVSPTRLYIHQGGVSHALTLAANSLGERRHRGPARRRVAVRRRAALVMVVEQRPHPRRAHGQRRQRTLA